MTPAKPGGQVGIHVQELRAAACPALQVHHRRARRMAGAEPAPLAAQATRRRRYPSPRPETDANEIHVVWPTGRMRTSARPHVKRCPNGSRGTSIRRARKEFERWGVPPAPPVQSTRSAISGDAHNQPCCQRPSPASPGELEASTTVTLCAPGLLRARDGFRAVGHGAPRSSARRTFLSAPRDAPGNRKTATEAEQVVRRPAEGLIVERIARVRSTSNAPDWTRDPVADHELRPGLDHGGGQALNASVPRSLPVPLRYGSVSVGGVSSVSSGFRTVMRREACGVPHGPERSSSSASPAEGLLRCGGDGPWGFRRRQAPGAVRAPADRTEHAADLGSGPGRRGMIELSAVGARKPAPSRFTVQSGSAGRWRS